MACEGFTTIARDAQAAVYPQISSVISTPATLPNRSPFELQYEMFKNGMELEGDEDFVAAEKQWTEVNLLSTLHDSLQIIEELETPAWRESSTGNRYLLARAHANRGGARASLGRQREAILDYSEALTLVPDKCEFWLSRGLAYEGLADMKVAMDGCSQEGVRVFYESALSDYDGALVLDPAKPQVYMLRGDVMALLQQHREALDTYRRGLALNPSKPDLRCCTALAEIQCGNIHLRCRTALAEIQCGNLNMGAAMVGSILHTQPDRPDMLLAGAALAWEAGELAESEKCRTVPDMLLAGAALAGGAGELAESKTLYRMAVAQDVRLLDDRFIVNALRWPAVPVSMVRVLRKAGTINRLAAVRTLIGSQI
ncbi:hypothetical protein JKP88DRAFT_289214 [Tribonema minus]|uniref:Tetratricopeptide repeat protein n=1 Tax=Tribonema minus TaxID=303371 RepID=A0A835Z1G2_9STRA|nr:hypothetical protein JKP88DRAFT_289214 [Tribonema minus]